MGILRVRLRATDADREQFVLDATGPQASAGSDLGCSGRGRKRASWPARCSINRERPARRPAAAVADEQPEGHLGLFAKELTSRPPIPEQNGPMTTASTDTPSIRERLNQLRPAVLEVAQRYGASNLRVFGSVALNQEHQDSDLDLLVDLPANQSLLALVGIAQELERLLGCPVDVAEPDSLHPLIRAEVLQHAIGL